MSKAGGRSRRCCAERGSRAPARLRAVPRDPCCRRRPCSARRQSGGKQQGADHEPFRCRLRNDPEPQQRCRPEPKRLHLRRYQHERLYRDRHRGGPGRHVPALVGRRRLSYDVLWSSSSGQSSGSQLTPQCPADRPGQRGHPPVLQQRALDDGQPGREYCARPSCRAQLRAATPGPSPSSSGPSERRPGAPRPSPYRVPSGVNHDSAGAARPCTALARSTETPEGFGSWRAPPRLRRRLCRRSQGRGNGRGRRPGALPLPLAGRSAVKAPGPHRRAGGRGGAGRRAADQQRSRLLCVQRRQLRRHSSTKSSGSSMTRTVSG